MSRLPIVLLALLTCSLAAAPCRAQFTYTNFAHTKGLSLVGNAAVVGKKTLRLTGALYAQAGALWYATPQTVELGFITTFQFRVTDRGGASPGGADGLAFVIQNDPAGAQALGGLGNEIGYGGLVSVAVEFDTWKNANLGDPNNNHISVHTNGAGQNSPDSTYSLGDSFDLPFEIADGNVHTAQILYLPGALSVIVDTYPLLCVDIDLANELDLTAGQAIVGFTAATYGAWENHDILNWSFAIPSLASLSVTPSSVVGGFQNAKATVSLTTPAPPDGIVVSLSSSDASATLPPSVTIPSGRSSQSFTVTTSSVSSTDTATLTASYNGLKHTTTLTVTPNPVASLTLSSTSVIGGAQNVTGTVTLSANAPSGGASVNLVSTNTNAAALPTSVMVPAGSNTATFTVTSKVVGSNKRPIIEARYNGGGANAALTVTPLLIAANGLTLSPTSVIGGSQNATGTVTLNAAPLMSISGTTASSDTSSATVTGSFTVAAGAKSGTFTVTSKSVTTTEAPRISVGYNGSSANATLTINP